MILKYLSIEQKNNYFSTEKGDGVRLKPLKIADNSYTSAKVDFGFGVGVSRLINPTLNLSKNKGNYV